ncbi:hypothetical protein J4230_03360 [Candidatus Woesearchaeota archaeon]|nr:hypothetical protein [Candidatus Woesearchaeota archaeon]
MLICKKDVNKKITEILGLNKEGKDYKVQFSMSINTDYWNNSFKMENYPFFNIETTITNVPSLENIYLLAINNLGGITKVFRCDITKSTLMKLRKLFTQQL